MYMYNNYNEKITGDAVLFALLIEPCCFSISNL